MPTPHGTASSLHWVVRLARAAGWPRAETIFLSADADMVEAWAIVVTTCGISDDQLVAEVSRIHDDKVIEAADAASAPDDVRRPRILIVDDDPVIAQMLSMVLERGGYEVLRRRRACRRSNSPPLAWPAKRSFSTSHFPISTAGQCCLISGRAAIASACRSSS